MMCCEFEYVNDTLLDEYYDDVDNFGNDTENDEIFLNSLNHYRNCNTSINYENLFTKMNDTYWDEFKNRLDVFVDYTFLVRRFNGSINEVCKMMHETDKAILVCIYDLDNDRLSENKFWIPKSLMHYRDTEEKSIGNLCTELVYKKICKLII